MAANVYGNGVGMGNHQGARCELGSHGSWRIKEMAQGHMGNLSIQGCHDTVCEA